MAQIRHISNFKKKLPESYDNFQKLAKNIEAFCFFPTFKFIM